MSTLFAQTCLSENLGSKRQVPFSHVFKGVIIYQTIITSLVLQLVYTNDAKFFDKQIRANSEQLDQAVLKEDQSDQHLHCLLFHLHLLVAFLCDNTALFNFRIITAIFTGVQILHLYL